MNSAFCRVMDGFVAHTFLISKLPSGAFSKRTVTTDCSPLSARNTVSEDWRMVYPSPGSTSSTIYDPGLRPVHIHIPLGPVFFCPITVPPVPDTPPSQRSWKVTPLSASWLTESYFSTTIAFLGTFSN